MVSLFGSKKRQSNQGFRKYNNEIYDYQLSQQYQQNVAGIPNNGIDRNASISNSAGSAALAALRLHQNSQPIQTPANRSNSLRSNSMSTANRANSMSGRSNQNRANSLRTYSYHPKGSYTPGQATIPDARRYSSLNSNTNLSNFQHQHQQPKKSPVKRLSSMNSNTSLQRPVYEDADEDEGETVITTQTTKVVDGQGRVQSITTKTIKTLPDGSNIIETTTKNISRGNSRNNSLRNNSILSSSAANINLQKIDEDLHDFEYNYELDNDRSIKPQVQINSVPDDTSREDDLIHNANSLRLNHDQLTLRTGSITSRKSHDSSPGKPLKSILKNTQRPEFTNDDQPRASPVEETFHAEKVKHVDSAIPHESHKKDHPYKTIGNPLTNPPSIKVPEVPSYDGNGSNKSQAVLRSPVSSPSSKQNSRFSPNNRANLSPEASATSPGSSIKFDERVETFPIYDTDFEAPKEKLSNQELYNKALEVAMEKVYGNQNKDPQSSPDLSVPTSAIAKKNKRDKKLEILGHSGVNDNYKYENHHKDFAIHSLRDGGNSLKPQSRKDRVKEEKKQQKELEKQLKAEEKQKKLEAKEQAKEQAKYEAKNRKLIDKQSKKTSPIRNIFGRKKKDNSDASTLGSSQIHDGESSILNGSPISARLNEPVMELEEPVVKSLEESHQKLQQRLEADYTVTEGPTTPELQTNGFNELDDPIVTDTPQIEPTISLDSDTDEPALKVTRKPDSVVPDFNQNSNVLNKSSNTKGAFDQTKKASMSINVKPTTAQIEKPKESPVTPERRRPFNPELSKRIQSTSVKMPILENINDDKDSGMTSASEYEDVLEADEDALNSPGSKRLDMNEMFYEAQGDCNPDDDNSDSHTISGNDVQDVLPRIPSSPKSLMKIKEPLSPVKQAFPVDPVVSDVTIGADLHNVFFGDDESKPVVKQESSPVRTIKVEEADQIALNSIEQNAIRDRELSPDIEQTEGELKGSPYKERLLDSSVIKQPVELLTKLPYASAKTDTTPKKEISRQKEAQEVNSYGVSETKSAPVVSSAAPASNFPDVVSAPVAAPASTSPVVNSTSSGVNPNEFLARNTADTSKNYTLADLIRLGKEDTTEDSFMSPDAVYESDSDASSRFSADLNAALRRITDDKEANGFSRAFGGSRPPEEDDDDMKIGKTEDPMIKSTPPTEYSDEKPSAVDVNPDLVPPEILTQETGQKKPKKKSKFKQAIYKYFVNSYK